MKMFKNVDIPFIRTRSNVFADFSDEPNIGGNVKEEIERPRIVQNDQTDGEDTVNYGYGRVFDNEQANQPMPQNGGTAFSNIVEPENNEPANVPDTSQRQRIAGNKTDWEIAENEKLINDPALKNAPENKPNRWLAGAGIAMGNVGDALMNGRSWGEAVGAGIGGFGGGAAFPKAFADLRHGERLKVLYKQREEQRKEEDRQRANKLKDAQIENIFADNQYNLERLRVQNDAKISDRQLRALSKLTGLRHFDPTNPQHISLAKAAGQDVENLKGWDDRNPVLKQVAGVSYQYNRQTGKFDPTNLPADESKAITDYTVEMPTGEKRTFRVPNDKAAAFATQIQALGAKLKQDESQFQRTLDQRKAEFVKNFQYKIEQDAKNGTLKKIELQQKINADFAAGKFDEATRDEMLGTLNKF